MRASVHHPYPCRSSRSGDTHRKAGRRSGYSLVELMVVMAITGVLAAVALPAFQGYVRRARTTEPINFLGVVKMRQEAYRMEFGGYAGLTGDVTAIAFLPGDGTVMIDSMQVPWPGGAEFTALGASPDATTVRFGYGIVAGSPGQANGGVAGGTDLTSDPYNVPAELLDFYFISQAVADLDGDATVLTFEVTSFSRDMWTSNDD